MQFFLLGPLEVRPTGGRRLPLGSQLQRRMLAALMLQANRIVDTDRLIDLLWGERPPRTARAGLQGRVAHLRRVLAPTGPDRLTFRSPGYVLRIEAGELDVNEFWRLLYQGRQLLAAGKAAQAGQALQEASQLWRGPALQGVDGHDSEVARLESARLSALEARIEADLRLGEVSGWVAELEGLVAAELLREQLHFQLMLALYQSGRPADALAVFRRFRAGLVDELGIEPGPQLQELHRRMLAADPALAPCVRSVNHASSVQVVSAHCSFRRRLMI